MTKSEIKENLVKLYAFKEKADMPENYFQLLISSMFNVDLVIAQSVMSFADKDIMTELIFLEQNPLEWSYNHVFLSAKAFYYSAWNVIFDKTESFGVIKKGKNHNFYDVFETSAMGLSILFSQLTREYITSADIRRIEVRDQPFEKHLLNILESKHVEIVDDVERIVTDFSKMFADIIFAKQQNTIARYKNDNILADTRWFFYDPTEDERN